MIPAHFLASIASSVLSEHIPGTKDARFSFVPSHASNGAVDALQSTHWLARRAEKEGSSRIVFIVLIPVLVILSGIFAGLTLGYMSLDETQLQVLSSSGTAKQREYAKKIKPIRKNGHLLLVTLLLANMIVNETLPVIADPVLGGGVPSVVVSTVLIVVFAEIIPQSICTRHGLYIGAKMAGVVRVLIFFMFIIAWPVAKLLELVLGPHHGIIYRRAELKELIALHAHASPHGGDLRHDTVTIIGATLDLQDKTVRHAMTPIEKVFMLSIDAKLDYDTLRKVCLTGHSRIPVYEKVEVTLPEDVAVAAMALDKSIVRVNPSPIHIGKKHQHKRQNEPTKLLVKKVIGILLVKQCVLLDPEDAVPVRRMRLNKVNFVPQNESLLGILDRFQEGRSHMAMVSRLSAESAASVKKAVKKNLTQRLKGAVRGDSSSSEEAGSDTDPDEAKKPDPSWSLSVKVDDDSSGENNKGEGNSTGGISGWARKRRMAHKKRKKQKDAHPGEDLEMGNLGTESPRTEVKPAKAPPLEQNMPADAVLSMENAEDFLQDQGLDPAIMPLGIITLEDVLEELIGEEIYDEFDVEGTGLHSHSFIPPGAHPDQVNRAKVLQKKNSAPELNVADSEKMTVPLMKEVADVPTVAPTKTFSLAMPKPIALPTLRNLGFLRSRSTPPTSSIGRDVVAQATPAANLPDIPALESDVTNGNAHGPHITPPLSLPMASSPEGGMMGLSQINEKEDVQVDGGEVNMAVGANGYEIVPNISVAPSPVPLTKPPSNPASPAGSRANTPPLEAYLVDRRRRAYMVGGNPSSTSSPSTPMLSPLMSPAIGDRHGKGGFKSSPLSQGAIDGALGVMVADEIKREKEHLAKGKDAEAVGSSSKDADEK